MPNPQKPTSIPTTTTTGATLPFVALPQGELLTVNVADIPMIEDTLGEGIHFQPLRLDIELGIWVIRSTFAPGVSLPMHYHTGTVDAYTLSGSWHYVEYPDQIQTAGSYLYEPSASVHTLTVPASNTEDTVVVFSVTGANINFNLDGTFHSILDAGMLQFLTGQFAEANGLGDVPYVGGGASELTD